MRGYYNTGMKEITKIFKNNIKYDLSKIGNPKRVLFFDIETTGLSPKNSKLYLWNFNLKKLITKDVKDTKPDKYALTLISTISYELQYKKPLLYLGNNKKFNSIKSVKIKNNKVLGEK